MKLSIYLFITLFIPGLLTAQIPQVPSEMDFAGIQLKITNKGQELIQKEVDAIHRSQTHYQKMVDKADLYFPHISKALQEGGVPDEFKYLCIQESGFRGDAVSSSNAVGYWQFKDFTAKEVGIIIDKDVDERMHIIYASKGAAKYLKKNNFFLQNWLLACQSYQQGLGGTQRSIDKSLIGAKKMTIDQDTYWYVIKFLAHKIAYEQAVQKNKDFNMHLALHYASAHEKLSDIASLHDVNEEELKSYNLWLKHHRIPKTGKEYIVLIPKGGGIPELVADKGTVTVELSKGDEKNIEEISEKQKQNPNLRIILKINKKKAIWSNAGDSPVTLALRGGITKDKFLKYNDMIPGEDIESGRVYYLQKKRNRSNVPQHITKPGETIWFISQQYGVKQKKLMKFNNLSLGEEPKPGRIIWLKKPPKGTQISYVELEVHPAAEAPIINQSKIDSIKIEDPKIDKEQVEKLEIDTVNDNASIINIDSVNEEQTPTDKVIILEDNVEEVEVVDEVQVEDIEVIESTDEESQDNDTSKKIIHEVKAGETLYSISRIYNVRVEQLVEWNQLKSLALSVGQKIKIQQP